jgi:hypothetical protein
VVIVGKEDHLTLYLCIFKYIQGDSGRNINILGCFCIGHCGKEVNLILYLYKYIQSDSRININNFGRRWYCYWKISSFKYVCNSE